MSKSPATTSEILAEIRNRQIAHAAVITRQKEATADTIESYRLLAEMVWNATRPDASPRLTVKIISEDMTKLLAERPGLKGMIVASAPQLGTAMRVGRIMSYGKSTGNARQIAGKITKAMRIIGDGAARAIDAVITKHAENGPDKIISALDDLITKHQNKIDNEAQAKIIPTLVTSAGTITLDSAAATITGLGALSATLTDAELSAEDIDALKSILDRLGALKAAPTPAAAAA